MRPLTLGSLFDGSGGFPLGGLLAGIQPVWASEVEPFPIRVTTKRLPFMKHYGDVSKMNGGDVEPVDIITFGSPCQDMSVAGKRAGLDGNRSNLFFEAIRIVKEMRCATDGRYPRWICWENVPGAFSSNAGADFKAVLDSICQIKDKDLSVPECGKWESAGEILGNDFSVAWRVLDAQFWGVPQRRKRIFLVADLTGGSAGEILFESEGLSGYTPQGFRAWQGIAGDFATSADASSLCLTDQGGARMDVAEDVTGTLRAEAHHPPCVMESAGFCTEHSAKARSIGFEEEMSPTLRAGVVPATLALENHPIDGRIKIETEDTVQTLTHRMGTGGMNVPLVMKIRCGCEGGGKGALIQTDKSATLGCNNDQTLFVPKAWDGSDISPTLTANNAGGNQRMPDKDNFNCVVEAYGICSKDSNSMRSDNPKSGFYKAKSSRCLDGNGGNPSCNQGGIAVVEGVPFTQNQRDEVRILGDKSGALCKAATKQQTYILQGSMIGRKDENGPQGNGVNEDVSFTLNTTDRYAVYAMTTGEYTQVCKEKAPTLMARDYKDATVVTEPASAATPGAHPYQNVVGTLAAGAHPSGFNGQDAYQDRLITEPAYTVRRLTPTECARLQGFPDWWCSDLGSSTPSPDELAFWTDVFETHRQIMGTSSKPKSQKQLLKWLHNPQSDAAEYKMWGNGIALPCVYFILSGIAWATGNTGR